MLSQPIGKGRIVESPTPPSPPHSVALTVAVAVGSPAVAEPGLEVSKREEGARDSSDAHTLPVEEGLEHNRTGGRGGLTSRMLVIVKSTGI